MSRNSSLEKGVISEDQVIRTGLEPRNHLVRKRTLNHSAKLRITAKWWSVRLQTEWFYLRVPLQSRIITFDAVFNISYTTYKFQKTWKSYNMIDSKK